MKIYIDFNGFWPQFWKVFRDWNRFFLKGWEFRKCAPRGNPNSKKTWFFLGKMLFFLIHNFWLEVECDEKHKETGKLYFKINVFLWRRFIKDFGANLSGFGCQMEVQKWGRDWVFLSFYSRGVQEASKSSPERPKSVPRVPKSGPRPPKNAQRAPKSDPRATKTCPGGAQGAIKGIFLTRCFVFLRFSAFFYVFLRWPILRCGMNLWVGKG